MLVAIVMMAMIFIVGLAIDTGQLFVARRTAQEAADAGAYAGAVVLYQGGTQAQAVTAATTDAQRNGYATGGATTVTINAPPLAGPKVGNNRYVEVIIQTQQQTALLPAEAQLNAIRVRGVAGAEPLNSGYAVMALSRGNPPDAFTVGSTAHITLHGGGILVNSGSPTAASDNGTIALDPGTYTDIHGGVGSGVFPNQRLGVPQQPDPFAGYPRPATTGCDPLLPSTPCTVYSSLPPGNLNPGIYTVQISGRVLNPGIYILEAGMGGDIDGTGVFLFNTKTNYPNSGPLDTCGAIAASGNHDIHLSAMTSGTYKGLLIYQDPICTAGMTFNGTSFSLTYTGTIYAPSAPVRLTGHASVTGGQFVASTFDMGNGTVDITYDGALSAQPVLPRLEE